jgi:large subunit ribosomal protein L18e
MSRIRKLQKRKTNPGLIRLIDELLDHAAKNNSPVWKDVAERLAKPRRLQAEVNVSKIEKYAKNDEWVLVPGKVLGSGTITRSVKVAALAFSDSARRKIEEAGGRCMSIRDLMQENPAGSGIRILV